MKIVISSMYLLDSLRDANEYIDGLIPQHDLYNIGTILNARHYIMKAIEQVEKLVEIEEAYRNENRNNA